MFFIKNEFYLYYEMSNMNKMSNFFLQRILKKRKILIHLYFDKFDWWNEVVKAIYLILPIPEVSLLCFFTSRLMDANNFFLIKSFKDARMLRAGEAKILMEAK